jgi:polar amino acid transport system substrate-binding protein
MDIKLIVGVFAAAGLVVTTARSGTIEDIKRAGALNVCANPDALPFSSDSNAPPGIHIELAKMLATQLDVSMQISWVHFRHEAKYTGCDAFMDEAVFGGSEGPIKRTAAYMNFETVAVTKPGKHLETLEDLNGLRVAMPSASLAHKILLDRPVDIAVSYVRETDILEAVRAGKVDVGLVSNVGFSWYRKLYPNVTLESHSTRFIVEMNGYPIAIGLRKSSAETVKIINAALQQLRERGALEQLFAKYGLSEALR